jgi:hypothetical protein
MVWQLDWIVQPDVSQFIRVWSYDRARYAWSESFWTPQIRRSQMNWPPLWELLVCSRRTFWLDTLLVKSWCDVSRCSILTKLPAWCLLTRRAINVLRTFHG